MKPLSLRLIACLLLPTFCLFGCDKDDDTPPAPATGNFNPTTTATFWTYRNTPGGPNTLTVTAKDTVAGPTGRSYSVVANSTGGNTYFAQDGGNYYRFGAYAEVGLTGVEELFLKDNLSVNEGWNFSQSLTVSGIPLSVTLAYTIVGKGETRVVNSVSFGNVTHVKLVISTTGITIGNGDFYYSNGVGMIENQIIANVPGRAAINQKQELTAYQVK